MNIDTTTCIVPDEIDLIPSINEVEEQGNLGACEANAWIKILEILSARAHDKFPSEPVLNLSRRFVYYWARYFANRLGLEGMATKDMLNALMVLGAPPESMWPYDTSKPDEQPPYELVKEAAKVRIIKPCDLTEDMMPMNWKAKASVLRDRINHALGQGRPVGVSFMVTQDFINQGHIQHDWRTFTWNTVPSPSNPTVGWHEAVIVGKSKKDGRKLLQNSWGPAWCDGGFCGLPDSFFDDYFWGVNGAVCSMQDTIGNIPMDTYLPKQYDPMRARIINEYLDARFAEIRAAVASVAPPMPPVTADEIDVARNWTLGTAKDLIGV